MLNKYMVITLLTFTLNYKAFSTSPIAFTSHKDPYGSLEQSLLQQLIKNFDTTIFVETGTYNGNTTAKAAPFFKTIHTVELYPPLAKQAKQRFANQRNITVHQGSSPEVFAKLLPTLKDQGRILFFLDAHYSGQGTAMDKEGPTEANGITAIRKEIAGIKQSGITDCVILIDDIRGFGTVTDGKEFVGCWAYPPLKDVCNRLLEINSNFECMLIGDMLLAFDKSNTNVPFTPMVKACTISRLFDGSNYSENELLEAEKTIAFSQGAERAFLKQLCQSMNVYKDPEFHHQLWYGLLSLTEKKFGEASQAFDKVLERSYKHSRIQRYTDQAKKACLL